MFSFRKSLIYLLIFELFFLPLLYLPQKVKAATGETCINQVRFVADRSDVFFEVDGKRVNTTPAKTGIWNLEAHNSTEASETHTFSAWIATTGAGLLNKPFVAKEFRCFPPTSPDPSQAPKTTISVNLANNTFTVTASAGANVACPNLPAPTMTGRATPSGDDIIMQLGWAYTLDTSVYSSVKGIIFKDDERLGEAEYKDNKFYYEDTIPKTESHDYLGKMTLVLKSTGKSCDTPASDAVAWDSTSGQIVTAPGASSPDDVLPPAPGTIANDCGCPKTSLIPSLDWVLGPMCGVMCALIHAFLDLLNDKIGRWLNDAVQARTWDKHLVLKYP